MEENPKIKEKKQYLEHEVGPLMEQMLKDILDTRPVNVLQFIQEWSQKKLIQERPPAPRRESEVTSDEDNFFDEHEEQELLKKRQKMKRKPTKKLAISAEAYGEYNQLDETQTIDIPKSKEEMDQIISILSQSFLFKGLDEKAMSIVVKAINIQNYKKDDMVIRQGENGDCLYIVKSGQLRCYKTITNDKDEKINQDLLVYKQGDIFGELALMYNSPRAANVIAMGPSICFALDRYTFNTIVKNGAIMRREKYHEFLQNVEILKTLESYERDKICDCLKLEIFQKDQFVIRQGEEGNKFYIMLKGTAKAYKVENGETKEVFDYKAGDYFGELALLNHTE